MLKRKVTRFEFLRALYHVVRTQATRRALHITILIRVAYELAFSEYYSAYSCIYKYEHGSFDQLDNDNESCTVAPVTYGDIGKFDNPKLY